MQRLHTMPFGAELTRDGQARFRLWAPSANSVELVLKRAGAESRLPMAAGADGWYATVVAAGAGDRYRYRINGEIEVPDPASRFQPEDVHGPSEIIDARAFAWQDRDWTGRPWEEAVLYELHVGSFSVEGDYAGVMSRLEHLRDLGVTAIELMPVSDFPGRRNWGYDGVLPYAPDSRYGRPDELKTLVQAAHALGLMVFLDVVYNHFGPEGNYLSLYAAPFFTERHKTPWGAAINFDDAGARTVRDYFIHNALYWIEEYHLDGLRFDAVHAIADDSTPDILTELAQAVAAGPGARRHVHLVLENDDNESRYLMCDATGRRHAYTAQWDDDMHHAFHVLATRESGGYYADYADAPLKHLGRCLTEGFAYQGDPSRFRHGAPRGESTAGVPLSGFVTFLQNHDQIGNRAFGERLLRLAEPVPVRALSALWLLAPMPPMFFMGQEWGTRKPFPFFCDFGPDLAQAVSEGRRREFARFPEFRDPQARERIPDPNADATFQSAVLDWDEPTRGGGREWLAWHAELLRVRRQEIVPRLRHVGAPAGQYRVLGDDQGLAVEIGLNAGARLQLLANLSDAMLADVERPVGRVIYQCGPAGPTPLAQGKLAPWSVICTLATPQA
jgi:maltooligosyltrehalose trehalohydrolase